MNNFRDLKVWEKAVSLATYIYQITESYPKNELYGLTSQTRRSVVSISSNIAEGAGRRSEKEFQYFLDIALGSCYELETQLRISNQLHYVTDDNFDEVLELLFEIQKMIYSLNKSLA